MKHPECEKIVQNLSDFTTHKCSRKAQRRMFHLNTAQGMNCCRQHAKALVGQGWLLVGLPS